MPRKRGDGLGNLREIVTAIRLSGCRYSKEVHAGELGGLREAGCEMQSSGRDVPHQHLIQARLMKARFARVQQAYFAIVDFDAENFVPYLSHAGGMYCSQMPAPDHRKSHLEY